MIGTILGAFTLGFVAGFVALAGLVWFLTSAAVHFAGASGHPDGELVDPELHQSGAGGGEPSLFCRVSRSGVVLTHNQDQYL